MTPNPQPPGSRPSAAAPRVLRPPEPRPLYARVALDRPLPDPLTYLVPEPLTDAIKIGSIVEVELRSKHARGVAVELTEEPGFKGPIKPIVRILTPEYRISDELIALGRWIADYYFCTLGEALAAIAFCGLNDVHSRMRSHLALASAVHWLAVSREVGPDGKAPSPKQRAVIDALVAAANEPTTPHELADLAGVGPSVLDAMLKRKWLERVYEPVHRDDEYDAAPAEPEAAVFELTPRQGEALAAFEDAAAGRGPRTILLQGVTGSGKTEVYLRAVEAELRRGKSAIVLTPEIALTSQTVNSFRRRIGSRVGVYHSRLSLGQKFDLWKRIRSGECRVLVGARSAVFAPMPDLGVVVVDEEHEGAYKQGETPRYHARDVAVMRAARCGAVAILGSATPSMESYHNAREGKYRLVELPDRVGPHASPIMTIVDMKKHLAEGVVYRKPAARKPGASADEEVERRREELGFGGASLISPALRDAIAKRIEAREQVVLLLNRRGFANHVLCLRCEKPIGCPNCDVTMTWHKRGGRLVCHWCGHSDAMPARCPNPKCGAPDLITLGLGTERIEEALADLFPTARTVRVDVDTMRGRRAFIDVWDRIRAGEYDIVLGTQMIAKGFHLESVTLAAVVSADFALFLPDFRASERTFQLLTQAAGRAGRGDRPGEVIVQSFVPHHYAIEHAARLAQKAFYEKELHIRRILRFPPIQRLISVLATSKDPGQAREQAARLANMLKSLARRPHFRETAVLGPAPAPIARIKEMYRWRILLRGPSPKELHTLLREGLAQFDGVWNKGAVGLTVDVDPVDLL